MPVPHAWKCTECGGALPQIEPDEEFVVCGFCKSTNAVVRERPLVPVPVRRAASPRRVLIGVAAAFLLASLSFGAWLVALGSRGLPRPSSSSESAASVAISLGSTRVAQGQPVQARFAALPASGSSYWAAIAPSGLSDATYGVWAWVDAGATSASLSAPAPGDYELRLHANYPARSTNVVGRVSFTVRAAEAGPARDVAEGAVLRVGDRGVLRFEAPLAPAPSERHWVTVVRAGSPDSEWGDWRYLEAGASSASLEFGSAGKFEVRLHDGYPRLAHHVILRRHVEVR